MKLIVDVDYGSQQATAAGVIFRNWKDSQAADIFTVNVSPIAPYEPGAFYKRELPCVTAVIEAANSRILDPLDCIIVDSYVYLGQDHPGMGYKVYESLNKRIPIIGVAKTHFHGANTAIPITRGQSKTPLYVTSVGIDQQEAAKLITEMHGDFRLPTLIKLADSKCRGHL